METVGELVYDTNCWSSPYQLLGESDTSMSTHIRTDDLR